MAFDYRQKKAYMRDQFVPFLEAQVSIASSSVLYGLAIYTVFAANWNEQEQAMFVFRLRDHYDRLKNSARIMDFTPLETFLSFEQFQDIAIKLITDNGIKEDALVRCTLFIDEECAGTKIYGLKISFSAYVYPLGQILSLDGIHVCVSSWQRHSDEAIPVRAKVNGSYVNSALMKNEALRNGFDDAIAIDGNGHVTEATVANIFFVRGGILITPDASTDILEGITRASILSLAKHLGILCDQRPVDRTEVYIADEAFVCGSSANITPVLSIDKRPLGDGQPGPITKRLSQAYAQTQHGRLPEFTDWLTKVSV